MIEIIKVFGVQFKDFNNLNHDNLIIDMSSDLGSYSFNFDNLSYVYAGAQKNMGIPGVTICLVKDDFLIDTDNPKYLNLKLLTKSNSILNTPPTLSIYVLNLVTNWMIEMGGIEYFQNKSERQSKTIYDFIDNNNEIMNCDVDSKFRSKSNIVFNFLDDSQNNEFIDLAKENGIIGINGHRSVGGIRVSLFNSIDDDMFEYFMNFFKKYIKNSSNLEIDESFQGEQNEWLVKYSKEILNTEHFDYFVFGHRHLPLDIKLSEKSRYINLGEWVNYYSYGVLNQGHFEFNFFESAFSKAVNR